MFEILLAAALGGADPAGAPDVPKFVNPGETAIDGWALKAGTYVGQVTDGPPIGSIYCDLKRNGLSRRAFRNGGFGMTGSKP